MAASELSVQPQLAQARAVRGIAAVSGINKQHNTSGVAAPRRAIAEIFIASPENAKDTGAHRARNVGPRRLQPRTSVQLALDRFRRDAAGRAETVGVLGRSGSEFAQPGRTGCPGLRFRR